MGRRSQDSTRSPALPGLFDSKTVRPLFLTWAVVCLMAVVVGASVARSAGLALWVPVGIWIIVGLVSLWMWFNTPRDATGAFAWLMTAGVGGLLVLAAVNDLGLASPGLAFFPLVVLMLALFDLHRTRIALITTLAAVGVLWLGWREGALGASAAATLDPALKTMALRRVVVLLAALATAAICGLMLARTLRAMLLRQRAQAQAERSHELFALSPVAQVLHRDGVVLEANAAAAALFGYAHADDMVGTAIPDHFADPVDRARFDERLQELSKLPAGAAPLGMAAWRFRSRHGTLHEVRTTAAPIEIDGARAVLTTCIDDTAQLAAERARADAQSLMARIIAVSPYGIALVDLDTGHLALVNPELERITGYSREIIGKTPALFRSGHHDRTFYDELHSSLARDGHWKGEIWNRRKGGELYAQLLSIAAIRGTDGEVSHYIAILTDISPIKAEQSKLDRIANYDVLTGIPNRRLLTDRLEQAIAYARRRALPLAVCMMDLDGFKQVNDSHGHEAGDRLLVEVARRLSQVIRADETVARLGGDEFVLIFTNPQGVTVFERVLQAVREEVDIGSARVRVSASLGIVYLNAHNGNQETLLRTADLALYQAKQQGRDRYVIAPQT